jgi:HEAT repeat protein
MLYYIKKESIMSAAETLLTLSRGVLFMAKSKFLVVAAFLTVETLLSLSACGGTSPALFSQRMGSSDVTVRREAAKELRAQPRNAELVPVILGACRDPDADVRVYGFYAIARVDARVDEEGVVGALINGMADTSADVRRAVVSSMGSIDPFPNTCTPHLVRLLVDPDAQVRKLSFSALADLEGGSVGSLMRNIDSKDQKMRVAVINVLAQIGQPAKSALPKLRQIAGGDDDKDVRAAAERAINFISGQ